MKDPSENNVLKMHDNFFNIHLITRFNLDGTWSETGDRYMLKLFRDYVFHQVTEDGRPWLDMAHVVQCLNKLDAGVPEKVHFFC